MDPKNVDLNVPYNQLPSLEEQPIDSVEENPEEQEEEGLETPSVEETKVPYSRFKNVHNRALEAEREAAEWRSRYESFQQPPAQPVDSSDVPDYWKKLYGDSPASLEGWKIQQRANEEARELARREALDAVRNERYEEAARVEENVETIDEHFESLSAFVGRDLTDKEQSAILDIVDEYTPQDALGNYRGPLLPFEKAWEIYELKSSASKAPGRQSRDSVAALTSRTTEGDTAITERDKNFNPLDWNSYQKRL